MTREDRFVDDGKVSVAQCMTCVYWRPNASCDAFPRGIPMSVLRNEKDHTEPIRGDRGFQFLPLEPVEGE